MAKVNFLIPFKKELEALDSHMGAVQLEETLRFIIGFVSVCDGAALVALTTELAEKLFSVMLLFATNSPAK